MKKTAIILSAVALVVTSILPATAQTRRSEAREHRQAERIWRGTVRGELTPRELDNLYRQQQRIDRAQWRAARDGYVTPRERRRIERMQDRASNNIRRKNHNARDWY